MTHVLLVEDESVIRTALRRLLERNDYTVSEADCVASARTLVEQESLDLVIADLRLPDSPGTDLIGLYPELPVLIMTSYASVRSAVEAMKLGAVDYIAKPFDHDELLLCVSRILRSTRLERQNEALRNDIARAFPVNGMVGSCRAMRAVFSRIEKVAPTDTTVLIVGESGTGKELVARAVHERSPRRDGPMVTVNCAAIPSGLIENELFGHEKGSFTGAVGATQGLIEAAHGGTLFLDEIGELPMDAQARLLRVLQDGELRRVGAARSKRVDIRLVTATHRDLPSLVAAGVFREDLFFRLHVVEIALPALRERGDDIRKLAELFLTGLCKKLDAGPCHLNAEALEAISSYTWPGNVRELENAIERSVILCDTGEVTPQLLAIGSSQPNPRSARTATGVEGRDVPDGESDLSLEDYFRRFVLAHQSRMTETELAARLGISRKTLWERRQRLGIARANGRG